MWFIYLVIGLLIGSIVVYVVLKPKMKTFVELDKQTAQTNKELQIEQQTLSAEISALNARRDVVKNSIADLEQQARDAGETMFRQSRELAEAQFEHAAEAMANKYRIEQQQAEEDYLQTLNEVSSYVSNRIAEYKEELTCIENAIADKQAILSAAVEASKRAYEMNNQQDFYRLSLSEDDKVEIKRLREVLPYLRDSEPLNKVIWKVYYEKPYTDMIGRVVGTGIHTGIYKITNIENNMCYVGQAANIADRWKQHIKRGIGAETPTRNKLYPAMLTFGVENFTFEIIEECDRSLLNDREDYWQDYFHAKDFGYSIK